MNPTIAAYNKYSKTYQEETEDFWKNFPLSTITEFLGKLKGKKTLDIGSGPGLDAKLLKSQGLDVTCADASEAMINITKSLGFNSVLCDLRKLPFPAESFDAVWAYTSLLHVTAEEMTAALKSIHQILSRKGVLLLGMIEGNFEGEKVRESMPNVKRYFKYYTEENLKLIAADAGFKFEFIERYTPNKTTYMNLIFAKI